MLNPVSWEPCFAARPVWQGLGGCKVSLKTRYFRLSCFTGRHWSPYLMLPALSVLCWAKGTLSKGEGKNSANWNRLHATVFLPSVRACVSFMYLCMYLLMSCALSINWWYHRRAFYLVVSSLDNPLHSISSPAVCHTADFHTQVQHVSSARPYKNVSPCFIEQSYNVL